MAGNGKGLAAAFVAGALVGLSAGGYIGFRKGFSMILDECMSKDAKEAQSMLSALKDLRSGDTTKAIETVESRLDDQLIIFDPQQPYPLSGPAASEVDKAILAARDYRSSYPRKSSRSHVDAMVSSLFSRRGAAQTKP